jgi:hypothetical protein
MGRHSIDYQPERADVAASPEFALPGASIAPPGGPVDPGVPGSPDAPSPDVPSTAPPTEPPPLAPEEPDDGSVPATGGWHAAGEQVL